MRRSAVDVCNDTVEVVVIGAVVSKKSAAVVLVVGPAAVQDARTLVMALVFLETGSFPTPYGRRHEIVA